MENKFKRFIFMFQKIYGGNSFGLTFNRDVNWDDRKCYHISISLIWATLFIGFSTKK